MKYLKLFVVLSVPALLIACNKDKTNDPVPGGIPKVKMDDYAVYKYDAQGRQTEAAVLDGSKIVYTYSGNIISEKRYDNTGGFVLERIHELNGSGFVQKTTYGAPSASRFAYQYNAAGQLVNEHFFTGPLSDSTDKTYFYSSSGRLDSVISSKNNYSVPVYKQYYEYAESRRNTISHINFGLLFMGTIRSAVPATKTTTVYPVGPQQLETEVYTYDAYNRISKVSYNGGSSTNYTYY